MLWERSQHSLVAKFRQQYRGKGPGVQRPGSAKFRWPQNATRDRVTSRQHPLNQTRHLRPGSSDPCHPVRCGIHAVLAHDSSALHPSNSIIFLFNCTVPLIRFGFAGLPTCLSKRSLAQSAPLKGSASRTSKPTAPFSRTFPPRQSRSSPINRHRSQVRESRAEANRSSENLPALLEQAHASPDSTPTMTL
jgi:hypothetical protein